MYNYRIYSIVSRGP